LRDAAASSKINLKTADGNASYSLETIRVTGKTFSQQLQQMRQSLSEDSCDSLQRSFTLLPPTSNEIKHLAF